MPAHEPSLNGAVVDMRSLVPLASHELIGGVIQCSESLLNNLTAACRTNDGTED
jgi:hypothetical protein